MSDPFALFKPGDKLPSSATLVNALLEGARVDANRDSQPPGELPFPADFYPHRVVFIRNTTQFQIPSDQPIPIGKPTGTADFYNGQVVFPVVSYVAGWATYARPLKRLPPGCAGPAVILGWLGPGKRTANYLYGGQVARRAQPQRAYGGTTFTGLPYVQATHRDFPRPPSSPWREAWLGEYQRGISYSGDTSVRFPKMESLGFLPFPWAGEVYVEFRNPVDQHGWWTPTLEFRITRGSGWGGSNTEFAYVYPPAFQSITADLVGGGAEAGNRHWVEPMFWQPAVTGFNPSPHAYHGNFNHDPFVSGSTFNPNGGAPPSSIFHTMSCPTHFSTKAKWQSVNGEASPIHRSIFGGGSSYYVFQAVGNWPGSWQNWSIGVVPQVRLMPGTEVVQIFETDRDDSITFFGSVVVPGIGTGPAGSNSTGSGSMGPELLGSLGFTQFEATQTNATEFVRRVSSGTGYGSTLGEGGGATASSTLSASGNFSSGPLSGSASLALAGSTLSSSGTVTVPGISGSASLTAAGATLSSAGSVSTPAISGTAALTTANATLSAAGTYSGPGGGGGFG
jgi:hypothetical protein